MNSLQRQAQRELQECQRSFEQQLTELDYRIVQWKQKEESLLALQIKVQNQELKLQNKLKVAKDR
jgi:hypothetical protein